MKRKPFFQWFVDQTGSDQLHCFGIKKVLIDYQSNYQKIQIIEVESLGKCLIIDGRMQSAEKDEFIYHEALVHPALLLHPQPANVLVIGAGEGATIRELLKYDNLKITGVDIDQEVIEFSRRYLGEWHQGAFDHPRFKLIIKDGWDFIQETTEFYEVIIMDLPEPFADSPASSLYTPEFYQMAYDRLTADGILVTQAEGIKPGQIENHLAIRKNLAAIFKYTSSYQTYIPSYDSPWGFLLGEKSYIDPRPPQEHLDQLITRRIDGQLRFYDGQTHLSMFYLPRYLRAEPCSNSNR